MSPPTVTTKLSRSATEAAHEVLNHLYLFFGTPQHLAAGHNPFHSFGVAPWKKLVQALRRCMLGSVRVVVHRVEHSDPSIRSLLSIQVLLPHREKLSRRHFPKLSVGQTQ